MTSTENFKNFLSENNAYDKYCSDIEKQHGINFITVTMGRKDFRNIINDTLMWPATDNCHLWETLSNTWNKAVSSNKQFYNNCRSIW